MQNIAGVESGIPLGTLAVYLDALETNVFLQQGGGEQRQILGYETIQTLTGIIFPMVNSRIETLLVW